MRPPTVSRNSASQPANMSPCCLTYVVSVYDMALFTYLIAFGHFSSELLIFRTAGLNPGTISPVIVSSEDPLLPSLRSQLICS